MQLHVYLYIYIHALIDKFICIDMYLYISVYIYMHIYIYTHIYTVAAGKLQRDHPPPKSRNKVDLHGLAIPKNLLLDHPGTLL